jgi:hypothetical protein
MQITLTQKDFPFPYNCSDVWKKHKQIASLVEGVPHILYKQLYEQVYNNALRLILKDDEGGIAHAIYNSNYLEMSVDQIRPILFRLALKKSSKFNECNKLFDDAQTVQECCQVYYDIVGIQCFMADGSVIRKQPLI